MKTSIGKQYQMCLDFSGSTFEAPEKAKSVVFEIASNVLGLKHLKATNLCKNVIDLVQLKALKVAYKQRILQLWIIKYIKY